MAVSIAALAIGAGIAIYGAVQKSKAEKKAKANVMPTYDIPQSEYDNQRLLESQAGQGMSDAARQAYLNNADRGLAASIGAIERSGGDANAMGGAYDRYNQGTQNLAIYDDQRREAHLANLVAQNTRMSAMKDKQWQLNQYAPWANRAQMYSAQMAGASQTMGQGVGIAMQGVSGLAGSIGQGGQEGQSAASQGGAMGSDTQGGWSRPDFGQPAVRGSFDNPGEYSAGMMPATESSNFTNNFGKGNMGSWFTEGGSGQQGGGGIPGYMPMYQ